jgi:hypothetical protein
MEGMFNRVVVQITKYITRLLTLGVHSGSQEAVLTDTQVHLSLRRKLVIHQEEPLINHHNQKKNVQILTYKRPLKKRYMMRTCDF